MTRAISNATAAVMLFSAGVAPLSAAPLSAAPLAPVATVGSAQIVAVGFKDGETPGSHRRRSHGGETSKSTEPSHADLHGATRESADKAYRKQYGF